MFYFLLFLSAFFALSFSKRSKFRPEYRLTYIILVTLIILLTGIRKIEFFPDLVGYEYYFHHGEILEGIDRGKVEFIYAWLNDVLRTKISFQLFCTFIAAFIIGIYSKALYKWSPYPYFSLFLFILVNYVQSCFILRQYMAMAICIIAIKYVFEKKLLRFLFFVIIATGFHVSAFIVLPVYFLYAIPPQKKSVLLTTLISLGIAVFICLLLKQLVPNLLGDYYEHYLENESEGSVIRLLMKVFIFLCYILATKFKFDKESGEIIYFFYYFMLLNIIVCIVGLDVPIFFRLREYFSLADLIGIPIIVHVNIKNRGLYKNVVRFMVIVYVLLLLISFNNFITDVHMNIRYGLFWL